MPQPQTNLPRQAGFTLVEIMVVIVIIGLLASIVAPAVLSRQSDAQVGTARADVSQIKSAVDTYYMFNHVLPNSLEELITPDKNGKAYLEGYTEAPKDPWGTPYEIRKGDGPTSYEVLSYGPDKQEGTDDDISSKSIKDRK